MKKLLAILILLSMTLSLLGCNKPSEGENQDNGQNQPEPKPSYSFINGINLSEFSIVYSEEDHDYSKRAAEYIKSEILKRTELDLPIIEDSADAVSEYEIVVGNTERAISERLNAETVGLEFSMLVEDKQIALEGDYFIIAAAAYFFIDSYVPHDDFDATIPKELLVREPIVKEADNYILLIGDGMGVYQTKLFEQMTNDIEYGDGEDLFYGYLLPYQGFSRTESLSGVTDSAAGGTALACGVKTYNEYIGRDKDGNDVKSLPELADQFGMGGGVMSTENRTGATPASFASHATSRNSNAEILDSQTKGTEQYGTIVDCGFNYFAKRYIQVTEKHITDTLSELEAEENGFFLMYEEAYIDKYCHNNDIDGAFKTVVRFNQAIGRFMEYAFYNPNTMVIITADHETGDLVPEEDGAFKFHHDDHTSADVMIFAYGMGAEVFDGVTIENIQIAHTIADYMGDPNFGDQSEFGSIANN